MILGKRDLLRYGISVLSTDLPLSDEYKRLLSTAEGKVVRNETYRKDMTDPNDYVIVLHYNKDRFEWCDIEIDRYVTIRKCNTKVLVYRELDNVIYVNII